VRIHKFGGLVCAFALTAGATSVTFTFTGSGGTLGGSSPFGDTRTYTNGSSTVTASAFSLPGTLSGNFTTAQLNFYNTLGLAVCDQAEGADCANPLHQIDNSGEYDFVLFKFNSTVDPISIVINPFDVWDKDVTYWVGNNSANLSTLTLATLGMNSRIDDDDTPATLNTNPRTVLLGGGTGNALLIGARLSGNGADGNIDRFKIESLTVNTTAPEPATFGLMGAALVGLGLLRRRIRVS
jgi:PEP-CTERM motif